MKLFYEVYLPVAVTIDKDGQLVGTPTIDWEGSPWADEDNVWTNEPAEEGEWVKDRKFEARAENLLHHLLDLGVDDVITMRELDQQAGS